MEKKVVIIFFLFSTLVFFHVHFSELPKYPTNSNIKLPNIDSINVSEGKKLALSICFSCHYNSETETLAGKKHGNPKKLGDFYSGNITQHKEFGIGNWTKENIYFFLRTGVKPNGDYVFDMPKYPNLSEEDMLSMIAFLKSDDNLVEPTSFKNPEPQYSFLMKAALIYFLRPIDFNKISSNKKNISFDNKIEYGRYLATAKYSCFDCHSRNAITNNYLYPEKSLGFFKGKNPHVNEDGEKIYSTSLIQIKDKYSLGEFIRAVKYGITPESSTLKNPMLPFVYLSDYELEAIYVYLNTLNN